MPIKYVVIREVKSATNKNNEAYNYCLDQDSNRWNLFKPLPNVEPNKAYAFYYEPQNGYNNLKQIQPVENVFKAQAIKETASRAELIKNIGIAFSYAKDLTVGGIIKYENIYTESDKIYDYINGKAESLMPKTE